MRISGTEPSSVILSQRRILKIKIISKQVGANGDGVINKQNHNLNQR